MVVRDIGGHRLQVFMHLYLDGAQDTCKVDGRYGGGTHHLLEPLRDERRRILHGPNKAPENSHQRIVRSPPGIGSGIEWQSESS